MSRVVSDEAIIYQLEKVDQGGAVSELVEDRIYYLMGEWNGIGFETRIESDEENPHYGDLKLPDGRYVVWSLNFEIQSLRLKSLRDTVCLSLTEGRAILRHDQ
jgi:hypothetical protein